MVPLAKEVDLFSTLNPTMPNMKFTMPKIGTKDITRKIFKVLELKIRMLQKKIHLLDYKIIVLYAISIDILF